MRESGMVFDKLVLTIDPIYIPNLYGPPESQLSGMPTLNPIGDKTVTEGQVLNFSISANDADGTIPVLGATGLPVGAVFIDNGDGTADFSWMPVEGDALLSPYSITFTATDADNPSIKTSEIISIIIHIWPTNGWASALPTDLGMNQTKLEQARDYALIGGGAGMITRGGYVVMSWGNINQLYDIKSATKSFGATALGVALSDGLVSLNDPAQLYIYDFGTPPLTNMDTGWLDSITLHMLATHTAGFDKPGGYIDLLFPPGTVWAYTDGGANWLADVLTVSFSDDLKAVLFSRIFNHLGITTSDLTWRDNAYRGDTILGIKRREFASGITANVDVLARIGYLYLRGGVWEGQNLISQNVVESLHSTPTSIENLPIGNDTQNQFAGASGHYGLLWWNNADGSLPNVPTDTYWAWGLGDNLIIVIPSLDIVVARTGSAWTGNRSPSYYSVVNPFIEPIVQSVESNIP
jgi:CubicO group peptidase (beta-lactamase class C family)